MWFKQLQLFQFEETLNYSFLDKLDAQLSQLAFHPCLPAMQQSMGWVPPIEEDVTGENDSQESQLSHGLVRTIQHYAMICLQVEEKILPATVVRQALVDRVKQLESAEGYKLGAKRKMILKDEITMTLLPRAFTKLTRIYAYIDIKNGWLVLGSANQKRAEQFLGLLKKSIVEAIYPVKSKNIAARLTHWLKHQDYPNSFVIEKACMLQDPKQENRIIRCKQQDLFAHSIQALLKDGCEAMQLAFSWQDRINFVINHDFSLSGIRFEDALLTEAKDRGAESARQQFDADFLIMTESLAGLLQDLCDCLVTEPRAGIGTQDYDKMSYQNEDAVVQ